jgi:hypothetical protein
VVPTFPRVPFGQRRRERSALPSAADHSDAIAAIGQIALFALPGGPRRRPWSITGATGSTVLRGTATIFEHGGSHASVMVRLGEETLHTEQIVLNGNLTTIDVVTDAAPVLRSIEVPLPDAEAALGYQRGVLNTPTGLYNRSLNSCVTHCGDVLRAGGVEGVPERTLDIIRWLKRLPNQ